MLNDFRKIVGIKSDEEAAIAQHEQKLHDKPKAAPTVYFELGGMHAKAGDKEAAIDAYLNAANLSLNAGDVTLAMAANTAIVQLDPEHRDALANLAYIRFQYGSEVLNKEYDELLQEIEERRHKNQHELTPDEETAKKTRTEKKTRTPKRIRRKIDPAFENERQSLAGLIEESIEESTPAPQQQVVIDLMQGHPSSDHPRPATDHRKSDAKREQTTRLEKKKERPKTGKTSKRKRKTDPSFNAARQSLVDIIEGKGNTETSASFEQDEPEILLDLREKEEETVIVDEDVLLNLKQNPLFADLSEEELGQVAQHIDLHTFAEDMAIIGERPGARALFIILEGDVELCIHNISATQASSQLQLVPGEFFGEHTFWKKNEMHISAKAATPCTIGAIPGKLFFSFAQKYPSMLAFLKKECKHRYFSAILAQTQLFQGIRAQDRQKLAEYFSPVHVKQGICIIPEGEREKSLFIIQAGSVEMFTTLLEQGDVQVIQAEQGRVSLAKLHEGDVFGEESLFTGEPASSSFSALTDILLLKLPAKHLSYVATAFPQFMEHLQKLHQQRITATAKAIQHSLMNDSA